MVGAERGGERGIIIREREARATRKREEGKKEGAAATRPLFQQYFTFARRLQKSSLVRMNYMSIKGPTKRSDWTQLIYVI